MNFKLKDYDVPSSTIFFDSKVQRGIGFIYGLKVQNGLGSIIKVPAGTYKDNKFKTFFNFKDSNNTDFLPFERNYPQKNSYQATVECFYIGKNIGTEQEIKYNSEDNKWTTDDNYCSYYFTPSGEITKPSDASDASIGVNKLVIKQLINDDVYFPVSGLSNFIIDKSEEYPKSKYLSSFVSGTVPEVENTISSFMQSVVNSVQQMYAIPNITYASIDGGTLFYDAKVEDKVGYVFGLQIKDNQADIIKVPAVRYLENGDKKTLFTFNTSDSLFTGLYPESNSDTQKCKIYFIQKDNLYYNVNSRTWSSDKSKATYFFTEANARQINITAENATVSSISIPIKYLVVDAQLNFPIRSGEGFEVVDINDYI